MTVSVVFIPHHHVNYCLSCLCCLSTTQPTVLFFKTTETIQDNINDRDNFFGLTTDFLYKYHVFYSTGVKEVLYSFGFISSGS